MDVARLKALRNLAKPGGFRAEVSRRHARAFVAALASATLGPLTFATLGPLAGVAWATGGSGGAGLGGTTTVTTPTVPSRTTPAATVGGPAVIKVPKNNPFAGRGMWIWEMPDTDRGNVAAIIAQAKQYRIRTLLIKSSDGTTMWSQFSRTLVTDLHEAGLKVCAWQFVYGIRPVIEANLARNAVKDGADCLVIDAESAYQGKYPAASTYIARLRKLIGNGFPVGLAGFPYVDFHLSFPYSVFLGPNGAQYNVPQMYWADIGTTVSYVFAHTYEYNEVYRRPIFPLGQLFDKLSAASIEQFNTLASDYGATGVSWWDWQSASLSFFSDIDKLGDPSYAFKPSRTAATIYRGNKGDLVIWAQEHLSGAGFKLAIDGDFGPETQSAVRAFQTRRHLPVTGTINGTTWNALVKVTPVKVTWTRKKRGVVAIIARNAKPTGHVTQQTLVEPVPSWVNQIPTRNELHGEPGAGRPRSARR
jgi:hypothetical protein